MNTYICWMKSGKTRYARASYSFNAILKVEKSTGEVVSGWDIAMGVPRGVEVLR